MAKKTNDLFAGNFPHLKLGLCQVYTLAWEVEENTTRTVEALERAADLGAQAAVTPECVFHGYGNVVDESTRAKLKACAEPLDGPHLGAVREVAKRRNMWVQVGFAERGQGGLFHNSAALISPEGKIVDVYRKVHCRPFEDAGKQGMFTPGDRFAVNEITVGANKFKVGTMICFDREIPESVRSLRALGAEIIFCPLACWTYEMASPANHADNEMLTRIRAAENELFIVVVNHAVRYGGGSFVVGPGGECLVQLARHAEVRVVDVPVGVVPGSFHSKPLGWLGWGYRRQDIYDKYLK